MCDVGSGQVGFSGAPERVNNVVRNLLFLTSERADAEWLYQRGLSVLKDQQKKDTNDEDNYENMFGARQYQRR